MTAPALVLAFAASTGLVAAVLALAGLGVARAAVRAVSRSRRLRRPQRAVVLGTGPASRRTARALLGRPETGVVPVGAVGDPRTVRGLPVAYLGAEEALPGVLRDSAADAVVVALDGPASGAERAVVRACLGGSMRVWAVEAHLDTLDAHVGRAVLAPRTPGDVGTEHRVRLVRLVRPSTRPGSRLRRATRAHRGRWDPTSRR